MIAQDFINELSRRLRDTGKKQWDDEFLISALNAAMNALTVVLPQAFTVNRTLTLAEGTEQTIGTDVHKIVSLLHNVDPITTQPGRAITKADMSVLDALHPNWRQDAPRAYVRHWMSDEYDESKYYVWPPVATDKGDAPLALSAPAYPDGFVNTPLVEVAFAQSAEEDLLDGVLDTVMEGGAMRIIDPTLSAESTYFVGEFVIKLPDDRPTSGLITVRQYVVPDPDDPSNSIGTAVLITSPTVSPPEWDDPGMQTAVYLSLNWTYDGSSLRLLVQQEYATPSDTPEQLAAISAYQQYLSDKEDHDAILSQYDADTLAFDQRNAEIAAWSEALVPPTVRGTFTLVPRIVDTVAQESTPSSLTAPINPGEPLVYVAPSGAAGGVYESVSTSGDTGGIGTYGVVNLTAAQYELVSPNDEYVDVFLAQKPDGAIPTNSVKISSEFYRSTARPESLPAFVDLFDSDYSATVKYNDPRMEQGNRIRFRRDGNVFILATAAQESTDAYSEGTTQAEVDQRQSEIQQYSAELAAYNAALAQEQSQGEPQALADGLFTVTDDIPINRAHFMAIQEFALYYAYAVDDDMTANSGRAQRHWLAFFQLLNKRENSDLRIGQSTEATE